MAAMKTTCANKRPHNPMKLLVRNLARNTSEAAVLGMFEALGAV